jgi:hypothetical protein
MSSWLRRPRE